MTKLATHTPAQLLKNYIVRYGTQQIAGVFTGWAFKVGKLPAEPDQVIALIDQGGPASFPHLSVDYRGVQILVRSARGGSGYQVSHLIVSKIRDMILGMPGHPPEFLELDGVTERGNIVPLGYDDQDRHIWSSNFQLTVEPETNALTHRVSL